MTSRSFYSHYKLTLNLSIQDVLDMIGVVSGMNNERSGVCARLKLYCEPMSIQG